MCVSEHLKRQLEYDEGVLYLNIFYAPYWLHTWTSPSGRGALFISNLTEFENHELHPALKCLKHSFGKDIVKINKHKQDQAGWPCMALFMMILFAIGISTHLFWHWVLWASMIWFVVGCVFIGIIACMFHETMKATNTLRHHIRAFNDVIGIQCANYFDYGLYGGVLTFEFKKLIRFFQNDLDVTNDRFRMRSKTLEDIFRSDLIGDMITKFAEPYVLIDEKVQNIVIDDEERSWSLLNPIECIEVAVYP